MMKNNVAVWMIIALIVLAGIAVWVAQSPGGSMVSATVANSIKITSTVTDINQAVSAIRDAAQSNSSSRIKSTNAVFTLAVGDIIALAPQLQNSVNAAAVTANKNMGPAKAALKDLTVDISYLQSMKLTLANAPMAVKYLEAALADISTINTNLNQ